MFLRLNRLLLLGFAGALLASADEVTFSLSTSGSFSPGSPSDLSFLGIENGFTGTTRGGTLSLNLGTFTLRKPSQGADTYNSGDTFTLNLLFFAPAGINGQTMFNAALTGALRGTVNKEQGWGLIDFGPTQRFHFQNEDGSGVFELTIDDLALTIPHDNTPSVSQVLAGSITNASDPPADIAPVPEPLSIVLFVTVIVFVVGQIRRKTRGRGCGGCAHT
jgi:hypothetical protein